MRDNHGRPVNYLRLSVTDRCNLRCTYCMPETGIRYLPKHEILSYEEMERLVRLSVSLGVNKLRITGGEPFLRKGLMDFLNRIARLAGLDEIHITTNGVLTGKHVPQLKALGISGINLSLDSVSRENFMKITRRDDYDRVLETFHRIIEYGIPLKINAVIMDGINSDQIIPLARLSEDHPVEVRFIEEMPFNGSGNTGHSIRWNSKQIMGVLRKSFPDMQRIADRPNTTAFCYKIPGHNGSVGVIAGFSRLFCGTCNRMRVTAKGILKMCLYDNGVLDLKSLMRQGKTDPEIETSIRQCVGHRFKDGFEAQSSTVETGQVLESMSEIGG